VDRPDAAGTEAVLARDERADPAKEPLAVRFTRHMREKLAKPVRTS
jgi:hypothetical protein